MIRFVSVLPVLFVLAGVAQADSPIVPVQPQAPEVRVENRHFDLTCHQEIEKDETYLIFRVIADGKGKYTCSYGRGGVWTSTGYSRLGSVVECEVQVAFLETTKELWKQVGNGDMFLTFRNVKEGMVLSFNAGTRMPLAAKRGARFAGKMTLPIDDSGKANATTYKVTCDASVIKDKDVK